VGLFTQVHLIFFIEEFARVGFTPPFWFKILEWEGESSSRDGLWHALYIEKMSTFRGRQMLDFTLLHTECRYDNQKIVKLSRLGVGERGDGLKVSCPLSAYFSVWNTKQSTKQSENNAQIVHKRAFEI
jgi:hypothetical protein